ncbi:hypothetical protein OC834_000872 [Tilletia horrida]|nr:hypothetical protein OC834_000872 [Tilletia horrida]
MSKAAESKDRHVSKNWPGSSAGPNKSKLTGDDELDYEERAAEDARKELEEARREEAKEAAEAESNKDSTSEGSSSSLDTSSTTSSA